MILCPIAIVASCKRCPAVSVCPLKTVFGDFKAEDEQKTKQDSGPAQSGTKGAD